MSRLTATGIKKVASGMFRVGLTVTYGFGQLRECVCNVTRSNATSIWLRR